MLIETRFVTSGDLEIDAYTYNPEEFQAVESTLRTAGISPTFRRLPPDNAKRDGRRYTTPANRVANLESILGGTFRTNGLFSPVVGTGNSYACREITSSGTGKGCQDLIAPNKSIAQVKCALMAKSNNWLGGVPYPGTCPRSH